MNIEYKILADYPAYRVGNDGSIWSRWRKGPGSIIADRWHAMRPSKDRDGYRRVDLHSEYGRVVTRKVCALVLAAFGAPRPVGMECRHIDGDESNDAADNLAWGTSLENHADKRRHGTIAAGLRHGRAKLAGEQIAEILSLRGQTTQQAVADWFGVSRGYVGQLWSGQRTRAA